MKPEELESKIQIVYDLAKQNGADFSCLTKWEYDRTPTGYAIFHYGINLKCVFTDKIGRRHILEFFASAYEHKNKTKKERYINIVCDEYDEEEYPRRRDGFTLSEMVNETLPFFTKLTNIGKKIETLFGNIDSEEITAAAKQCWEASLSNPKLTIDRSE